MRSASVQFSYLILPHYLSDSLFHTRPVERAAKVLDHGWLW